MGWLWNLNRPSLSPKCLHPSSINQLLPADISWYIYIYNIYIYIQIYIYISLNRFTWIMDSNVGFTGKTSPMIEPLIWGSQMVIPDGDVLGRLTSASVRSYMWGKEATTFWRCQSSSFWLTLDSYGSKLGRLFWKLENHNTCVVFVAVCFHIVSLY